MAQLFHSIRIHFHQIATDEKERGGERESVQYAQSGIRKFGNPIAFQRHVESRACIGAVTSGPPTYSVPQENVLQKQNNDYVQAT